MAMGIGDVASIADPLFGAGFQPAKKILGCGGKIKKPNPYAGKGGNLGRKGDKLLDAYNYLYPRTLELVQKTAAGYGDLYRSEADKTRADELAGFQKYGPGYVAALDAADPLRAKTRGIISANLDEGLDPSMQREVQQGSRGAWAARGLVGSPGSAVDELLTLGSAGKRLEDLNIGRALQFLGTTDPFLAYAGRPSTPQGANIQSPNYAGFTDDLFSYDVNSEIMRQNAAQAAKNRTASYINSAIGAVGNVAGGALAGGFI